MQRVALQLRKVYKESGVSTLPISMIPFVQLSRSGCLRAYALSLWSSVSFPPDLMVPSPYHVLPIVKAVFLILQLDVRASPPFVLNGSAG